jgi:hypothetical protein
MRLKRKSGNIRSKLLTFGLIFCLLPAYALARSSKKAHGAQRLSKSPRLHKASNHSTTARASHHRRFIHQSSRSLRHRRRASNHRSRSLEIPRERAEQIQEALIQAGDLHGQPTGRWDEQTREAMKRYQQANGFNATGLPDAKSLMKMGLGPHPLPQDVDPLAQARPGLTPPSASDRSSSPNLP